MLLRVVTCLPMVASDLGFFLCFIDSENLSLIKLGYRKYKHSIFPFSVGLKYLDKHL